MSTIERNCKATYFSWKDHDYQEYGEPGQGSKYVEHCYTFACPECGRFGSITCTNPKTSQSWLVESGSLDDVTALTLFPSIHCIGCCGWHGFLRNGEFQSC